MPDRRKFIAYTLPMATFLALLALVSFLHKIDNSFLLKSSEYWVYPLQTILCGALVAWFWREYHLRFPRGAWFAIAAGVAVFVLWIAPQQFLGFSARTDGFNPEVFAANPTAYWATVVFRFLRLVVVVPLVEEIVWRGFLLRYFIREDFDQVPFGTFSWQSFGIVTVAFTAAHSMSDWPAALLTGAIYNAVAYRTKNLSACVLTHAITNLLLGLWIMNTKQWGFW
jgi:hypothetical protein